MKIDRNVPMPVFEKPVSDRVPVEMMEIGDSVFLTAKSRVSALSKVRGTALKAWLKHNYKSAVEGDGFRVWRIA